MAWVKLHSCMWRNETRSASLTQHKTQLQVDQGTHISHYTLNLRERNIGNTPEFKGPGKDFLLGTNISVIGLTTGKWCHTQQLLCGKGHHSLKCRCSLQNGKTKTVFISSVSDRRLVFESTTNAEHQGNK